MQKPITADDIKAYLDEKYNQAALGTWRSIGISELSLIDSSANDRRVDYWSIDCWQSKGFTRRCYEIKVSRSDWLAEKKKPEKKRNGMFISNEFFFITPPGIIKLDELPTPCGLIEVYWTNNQIEIDLFNEQLALPAKERSFKFRYFEQQHIPQYREYLTERVVRKALWRDEALPTWRLVVSIARRLKTEGAAQVEAGQ